MDLLLVRQVSIGRFTVSEPEPAFIYNSDSALLSPWLLVTGLFRERDRTTNEDVDGPPKKRTAIDADSSIPQPFREPRLHNRFIMVPDSAPALVRGVAKHCFYVRNLVACFGG